MLMLALRGWLAPWYGLPEALLVFMGIVNLGYAAFGGVLVLRGDPRPRLAPVLIVANFVWAAACVCGAAALAGTATVFGLAHLALEGLFVGSLAAIERRRWRALRQRREYVG